MGLEDSVLVWRYQLFVQAATTTWFCYDYLLTLPDELRCIWWRPFSSTKLIFLFLRYSAFANLLQSIQRFVHWHLFIDGGTFECNIIWKLNCVTEAIFYLSLTTFTALRIYAISGLNMKVSLSMLCLGIVFVCCDLFLNTIGTISPRPFSSGCFQSFVLGGQFGEIFGEESFFNAVYAAIGISGTCCLFLSELVVQAYTWRSTWQVIRITKRIGSRKPLLFFLLRDGTVAWLVLTMWAVISESLVSGVDLRTMTITCISIIVCRVILRLRQIQISDSMDGTAGRSWMSAQFIGNVGAPLDLSVRQERHHDEDEDEEVVISVHGNPLIAGLEVAQLEDDWVV